MADYGNVIKYIQLPTQRVFKLRYLPIDPSAVHHFKDVKRLILLNEAVMLASIPLLVCGLKKQKTAKSALALDLTVSDVIYFVAL